MSKSWIRAAAAGLVLVLGQAAHAQDKIVSKDGKERTGRIVSEDFDGLKLAAEGGTVTVPWRDVDSVRYANSTKYQQALDKLASDGPQAGVPLLEALAADTTQRAVLRHGVLYALGMAQRRLGNDEEAIKQLEALLKEFPRTRYLVSSATTLLSLYTTRGDAASSAKALDAALAAARAGGGGQQPSLDYLSGRLLEEQKKYADAERVFAEVVRDAGNDVELALAAKLAVARCAQRAGGRDTEVRDKYREIVTAEAPNEILAGAWNGLGDLALAEGMTKRDTETLRVALFSYLRGVVLYVPQADASTEEYERALAGSARAFQALGDLDTDAARKKLFQGRARQRLDQLRAGFPRSRYLTNGKG